ncbi:hypothetical protein UlMin_026290 [Ulmus minor]
MASIAISASLQCSSNHEAKKQQPQQRASSRSFGAKQILHVVTPNVEAKRSLATGEQHHKPASHINKPDDSEIKPEQSFDTESSVKKFIDVRWKNGTWDLNMFVKDGKMDWDGLIVAEARRRKFLELYPEASSNEDPVLFKSSIIPWWACLLRSYLPEAELINGRAAMVGFLMSYVVDALTGLDVVGQSGNFICKAGLFVTIIGVIFFRKTQDFEYLKKVADEATLYDKQWQSSWQDQNASTGTSEQKEKI